MSESSATQTQQTKQTQPPGWQGAQTTRPMGGAVGAEAALMRLQNTAGNRAVSQLLGADTATANPTPQTEPAQGEQGNPWRQLRQHYLAGEHSQAVDLIQTYSGPGVVLPSDIQTIMADHLGHNFSDVRIHTDDFAVGAAQTLEANAFTVQRNIYFGRGMYAPTAADGQFRLAHELVHAMQQRGTATPTAGGVSALEAEAERAATVGLPAATDLRTVGAIILREPTYPRRTTGNRMIQEAERVITLTRDPNATDETTRLWSQVGSNFGAVTAGSIARRVWTNVFLRHVTEPESRPGVESAHPRYFYSHTYGWIDGQHFFGFIDFAEQQYQSSGHNRQQAFDAATRQGREIEQDQQRIRDYVAIGRPPATDVTRFMQVQPPNTPLFRVPPMVYEGAARAAAGAYASLTLGGTQGELYGLLNAQQRQKFLTDSAKSAFTYEDFQSNQLGTRFFFQHGIAINQLPVAARESAFRNALITFFTSIRVENDPARVDQQATADHLPGRERFEAPKTTEEAVRSRHPDLFQLPSP